MEWLTTGQMIDKLEVGQMAENQYEDNVMSKRYVYRTENGIVYCSRKGVYLSEITLSSCSIDEFLKSSWRLLPKYVSFEEAVTALKEGKTVYYEGDCNFHHKITPDEFNDFRIGSLSVVENGLSNLIDGKWTIEGDK